ncbi:BTB/POZ domain-containing protein 2-like [Dreissena polymorpha]|uniref:BTB domain-containing protein n=1 Tax=Dreissena polymorpha TaxID=45954 RepID=A0A9D4IWW8_DREPO|nr:BTB/POZ domain-containing protein 2-like [Dreissena polymorpha]XP_052219386.1 BTB/POZ domain-containing protein 2-like [Dreissena polymorpha]XP_052219387.1 BTB/POZ domain-containing protein 2-like [Dreissena polymorpha]XP_052219389.1 BTB/POZ domain-containing protein 2-like [Dreissena polymorpha]KAH3791316.1 hypothetical protein DPMN_144799 [Dreissena polymorpha]
MYNMETAWQHSDSFLLTNLAMLEKQLLCDVTLVGKHSTDPIKCHKFILVSRSSVFEAMLCGPLAETNDVINISDIEESILKSFVRYLYSNCVEITAETVLHLMYAAKKYDVLGLQTKCRSFLDIEMSAINVCTVLDQAIAFDNMDFQKICLKLIMRQSKDVLETESFVEISRSALKAILMCDNFGTSECELFNGCIRWARHACKSSSRSETDSDIRDVLGKELIDLIRFPAMSGNEFAENVAGTSLLCQSDIIDVFRSIITQKTVSLFKSEPRISLTMECLFIRCETFVNDRGGGFSFGVSPQINVKGNNFSFLYQMIALLVGSLCAYLYTMVLQKLQLKYLKTV